MKKNVIWIIIAILIVLLGFHYVTNNKEIEGETVKIGFIGSLTGVDPDYGESMKNGLELAIKEINENGGISGKNIEIIYEDGKCIEGAKAASAAQKLINIDNVNIIIDGSCSTGLLAYAPLAEEQEVLVITAGATSNDVTYAGDYIFRNVPSSSIAGSLIASIANEFGQSNFAIISENSDYAKTMRDSAVQTANEIGLNIVFDEQFSANTTDFRTLLIKIKNAEPDALLVNPQSGELATQIIKQAREIGLDTQFYMNYFTNPSVVKAGPFMNGVLVTDLPSLDNQGGKGMRFLEKYEERFDTRPPYQFSSVLAYDLGYLITEAIEKVGEVDSDEIKDYLNNLEEFEGAVATYGFDENGDVTRIPHVLKEINNGEITTLKEIY